jgi:SAM-dependent methyltransferase
MTQVTSAMREFWSVASIEQAMHERVVVPADPAVWNDAHQTEVMTDLLTGVTLQTGEIVLDYGCGVGRLTRSLLLRQALVWAVDVSPVMLEYTRQYCFGLPGLTTILCDGFGCHSAPSATAQGAVSCYCVQHMPSLEMVASVLRDIYRILVPGGWFVLQSTDHGVDATHGEVGFVGTRQRLTTLLNISEQIGFTPVRVVYPLLPDGPPQYLITLSKHG